MRKHGALFLAVFMALLSSCSNPSGGGNSEPSPDGKTWVCFVNGNDFSVSVYSDSSRFVKFTDVGANAESAAIKTEPSAGAVFYASYHILIDNQEFSYNHSGLIARIDAEKTTRVSVPLLSELSTAELTKPVTTGVYIKIQNAGTSALVLRYGASELIPQGAASPIINGGETARYEVSGGPVSGYSFMKNTVDPVAFPAGLTDFVPGHLYSFKFDGNVLTLLADKPITIAQALGILPPENISAASLPNGSISLTWDKAGTETGYVIYRADSETGTYMFIGGTNVTSYTDTTVTIGNTYYYRVSSVKNNVEGGKSNTVSAKAEIISLASPQGLTVTGQTENSISLSWQTVSGATGYKVYRGSSSGTVNEYVAETVSAPYTVTGLAANTDYYFTVSAVHGSVESLPSAAVQGKTSLLGSPQGLTVTGQTENSISLSWQTVSGATGYKVYKGSSSGAVDEYVAETVPASYTVMGLAANTSYYFTVSAIYESVESLPSAAVQGKTLNQYTVTFIADGGIPAEQTRTVGSGFSLGSSMPSAPTRADHSFNGWYTAQNGGGSEFITASTPVTGDVTVYAWWGIPDNLSLADALAWIYSYAVTGGVYTITLKNDETIAPRTFNYSGKTVSITLSGGTTERTISLSTTGVLFTVGDGVTLTLGSNVTLQGRSDNTASLVRVNSGGTLVMNTGSKISENKASSSSSSSYGGGVYVAGGTFTMFGGEISENTASSSYSYSSYGGGVYVAGGTFTMSGGEISENTASSSSSYYSSSYGGGVYVAGGTFTMSGGEISENTASASYYYSYGGGVYVAGGMFTMSGGEISGNTASSSSSSYSYGGGVYVNGGTFTMSGGEISENTGFRGGGVYVGGGTFTKQAGGGAIYGSDSTLKNTATGGNNYGHAVYVNSSGEKRNTTAGSVVTLDSTRIGEAGGWE